MARFSVIPAAAVIDSRLSLRELSVLCAIGIHTDRNGWCYPSSERLGEMLGIQGPMVRKSVAELVRLGYVQVVARRRNDGGQTSNAIRVIMDAEHPSDAMRFCLEQSTPVPLEGTPPVPSVGTPPVPSVGTPPVPLGGTRKPPSKSPNELKTSGADAPRMSKREQAENWPLPEWIDRDAWKEWIGSRTKPMAGVKASIEKLERWRQQGHDPNAILFDCASNGYQGLFLTNNLNSKGASNGHEPTDFFARRRGESLVEHATRINRYHDERERAAASQQAAAHLGADGGDLWSSVDDAHGRIPAGRGWVIDHGG